MYEQVIDSILQNIDLDRDRNDNEENNIEIAEQLNEIGNRINEVKELRFEIEEGRIYYIFKNSRGKYCNGSSAIGEELKKTMEELVSQIVNGEYAIEELNKALEKSKIQNGSTLSLRFKWGNGKNAAISYWDYNNIEISCDKSALDKIIQMWKESDLEWVKGVSWDNSVVDIVSGYNKSGIGKMLESRLESNNPMEELTRCMMNREDIIRIANSGYEGSYRVKSVEAVKELGQFICIVVWDMDFSSKEIGFNILDNTVIDVENNRFVTDQLFDRVERRIFNSIEESNIQIH